MQKQSPLLTFVALNKINSINAVALGCVILHMKNEVRQIYKCHTKIGCHLVLFIYFISFIFFNHSTFPEQLNIKQIFKQNKIPFGIIVHPGCLQHVDITF